MYLNIVGQRNSEDVLVIELQRPKLINIIISYVQNFTVKFLINLYSINCILRRLGLDYSLSLYLYLRIRCRINVILVIIKR